MHESKTMLCVIVALAMLAATAATAQNGSPCNEGRDPVHEPRNPYAICLPEIGRMDNSPWAILYLFPVGDVDNSGVMDFLVYNRGGELLLYKGSKSRFPLASEGQRIGPSEKNSITEYLACGDWDSDHHTDIAVRIRIQGDTSGGNIRGAEVSRLVIFWGNDSGNFSLQDTTRLESGAQMWISINPGVGEDFDGDGVSDLFVNSGRIGLTNNEHISIPRARIYRGHFGKRWGRDGISRHADWIYWNPPPETFNSFTALDQDQDGVKDIVFSRNVDPALGGSLSILYGSNGQLPDTANVQTIPFESSKGRFALFSDVTGDNIPDLLIGSGRDDFVKVYIGFKGQRLLEQYGSGNDSAQPGNEKWWGKPWATIWLPRKINPNWFGDNDNLFDLGDVNRDGIGDIFAFSWPYVMEYNGGDKLDSMADALINITPGTAVTTLKRLGNIDGSGRDIIALVAENSNDVRFYSATKEISSIGVSRRLPPGTGKASAEDVPKAARDADEELRLSWHRMNAGQLEVGE